MLQLVVAVGHFFLITVCYLGCLFVRVWTTALINIYASEGEVARPFILLLWLTAGGVQLRKSQQQESKRNCFNTSSCIFFFPFVSLFAVNYSCGSSRRWDTCSHPCLLQPVGWKGLVTPHSTPTLGRQRRRASESHEGLWQGNSGWWGQMLKTAGLKCPSTPPNVLWTCIVE